MTLQHSDFNLTKSRVSVWQREREREVWGERRKDREREEGGGQSAIRSDEHIFSSISSSPKIRKKKHRKFHFFEVVRTIDPDTVHTCKCVINHSSFWAQSLCRNPLEYIYIFDARYFAWRLCASTNSSYVIVKPQRVQ